MRLVDGIVPHQGRVEICRNAMWTSICSSSWENRDAAVVCRQLGYHSGRFYKLNGLVLLLYL